MFTYFAFLCREVRRLKAIATRQNDTVSELRTLLGEARRSETAAATEASQLSQVMSCGWYIHTHAYTL